MRAAFVSLTRGRSPCASPEAYFESHSLAPPPIHREPSTLPGKAADHVRIWLVHQGLRFELPAARALKAEDKLAAKVLKYLKTQKEEQEAKKTA